MVVVVVHSEQVPENIVQFSLRGFVKDFNCEGFELRFFQIGLVGCIVFIKILLQLCPNLINKLKFLGSDSFCDGLGFKRLGLDWLVDDFESSAQEMPDEGDVLLKTDEPVLVSV